MKPDHPPTGEPARPARRTWVRRWAPAAGLLLLSPFCAEYLVGYQGVITDPFALLVAVLVVLPIYGAPAVLIREVTRRLGRGWPTMVLLAAAAGLVQAGLIDQSLLNPDLYVDETLSTQIPILGIDAGLLLTFVVGHIVWSFGAPIAVIECCAPTQAKLPWLGIPGLVVITAIYIAGALFYYNELVVGVGFQAPVFQLVVVTVAIVVVVVTGLTIRPRPHPDRGPTPPWWSVGLAGILLATAFVFLDGQWDWWGIVLRTSTMVVLAVALVVASRRPGWEAAHVLAVAGGVLLVYAGMAFLVNPEGVARPTLIAARAASAAIVLALLLFATWRLRRARPR